MEEEKKAITEAYLNSVKKLYDVFVESRFTAQGNSDMQNKVDDNLKRGLKFHKGVYQKAIQLADECIEA